jgi:trk system potassium uptake protein
MVANTAPAPIKRPRIALRLLLGLAALVLTGASLLLLPQMSTVPGTLRYDEALFTAVSALTVTGLSVITPGTDLTLAGQIALLVLIQLGGVGYMVLAITMFRLLGRRVTLADRMALQDALGLLHPGGIVELTRHVLRTVLLVEAAGALLLWLNWREFLPGMRGVFYAIFHAISAFCNAGFELFSGQPEHVDGIPKDNFTLIVMGTLIFLGVIGIPVLFDLVTYWRRRYMSLHSRITIPLVLTIIVVGAAAFYIGERLTGGLLAGLPTDRAVTMTFFQVISSRTAGFVGVPEFLSVDPSTKVVMMSLMFIGGSPASMGGGITTGTLAVLMLALFAYARGWDTPIIKGRAIPGEMVRKGAAILTASIVAVLLVTWLIALTHPIDLVSVGFEVVSAFATCGLSLGVTSELNLFGRGLIMLMMFWGRLGPLTILFLLAGPRAHSGVKYPEERILIG